MDPKLKIIVELFVAWMTTVVSAGILVVAHAQLIFAAMFALASCLVSAGFIAILVLDLLIARAQK